MANMTNEELNKALGKMLMFFDGVHDRLKDGNFDLSDIIATGADLTTLIYLFNNFEDIKIQVANLTEQGNADLLNYLREECNMGADDEELKNLILIMLDIFGSMYTKIKQLVAAFKVLKAE